MNMSPNLRNHPKQIKQENFKIRKINVKNVAPSKEFFAGKTTNDGNLFMSKAFT